MRKKAEAVETGSDEIVVKNKTAKKVMGFIFLGITLAMVVVIVVLVLQSLFKPTYELSEDGQYYIVTDVGDKQKELEIKAEYEGLPVKEIGKEAFKDAASLEKVVIPEGVTTIGYGAFENCSALKEVSFPSTVTVITENAFKNCDALEEVVIPDTVTEIESYAFYACDSVKKISIGKGVTYIGREAFAGCVNVEEIYYNPVDCEAVLIQEDANGKKTYNIRHAFYAVGTKAQSCTLTIGKDVTYISMALFYDTPLNAFDDESGLTAIVFEEGSVCKIIGDSAFQAENFVEQIVLPKTITRIGEFAFAGCEELAIFYMGTNAEWSLVIKGNFNKKYSEDKDLDRVKVYFYSEMDDLTRTDDWHYVDGVPTLWTPAPAEN